MRSIVFGFLALSLVAINSHANDEKLAEVRWRLSSCAIKNRIEVDNFLKNYAMEVRSETNLTIQGEMKTWNFGILGGVNLLKPLTSPGPLLSNILGGLGGISVGGGTGVIQGEGSLIHADAAHAYVLTLFDEKSWADFDKTWRNFPKGENVRDQEISPGLKAILTMAEKASHTLPNFSHFRYFQKLISDAISCLNQMELLKSDLQFEAKDQQLAANIGRDIEKTRKWFQSVSLSVFVVAPSLKLKISDVMSDPVKDRSTKKTNYKQVFKVSAEQDSRGYYNLDPAISDFFSSQEAAVKGGRFVPGDGDMSSYFIYLKTAPKRLSSNWSGL